MPRHKLLLADDSATIQKVVNLTFAEEGIEVIAFGDGSSAWNELSENVPDVVMADVHMPGMTGYELCERIRSNDSLKDLPVLLLVGSFEPFDEAEAVRVGANGHLTKPFQSIKQLVEQVRELIAPADHPVAFEETIPLNVEATPESGPADELLETQPLEPSAASEETDEPDTSDIDSLYLQSLENTAEMETPPMMADGGSLGDVSSDDSLIDTVPAGGEPTEFVPEELPAEFEANGLSTTLNDSPAISREVTDPNASDHVSVSPFEITLSDGAPVAESQITSTDVADLPQFEDTIRNETPIPPFTTGDILDIPGTSSASSPFAPEQPVSNGGSSTTSVVNVSPELIDLIVQKVIERLEEKQDRGSDPAFS